MKDVENEDGPAPFRALVVLPHAPCPGHIPGGVSGQGQTRAGRPGILG